MHPRPPAFFLYIYIIICGGISSVRKKAGGVCMFLYIIYSAAKNKGSSTPGAAAERAREAAKQLICGTMCAQAGAMDDFASSCSRARKNKQPS